MKMPSEENTFTRLQRVIGGDFVKGRSFNYIRINQKTIVTVIDNKTQRIYKVMHKLKYILPYETIKECKTPGDVKRYLHGNI